MLNVQNTSLVYQKCFLTVTAIDNVDKVGLLPSSTIYISTFCLLSNLVISIFYFLKKSDVIIYKKNYLRSIFIILLIIYPFFRSVPFLSFLKTVYDYTDAGNVNNTKINLKEL